MRLPARPVLFLAAFAVFLIARLPLAPFLAGGLADGFGFANSSGTLWAGRIEGLSYRGRALGDAVLSLRKLPLFGGRAIFDVRMSDGPVEGDFTLSPLRNGGFGLGDGRIRAQIHRLLPGLPGLVVAGISLGEIRIGSSGCIRSDARFTVPDLALEAKLLCRDGRLVLFFDAMPEPMLVTLGPVRTLLAREGEGYRLELGLLTGGTES